MKILKNRLVIGCLCIIAAFAIGFLAVPKLTDMLNEERNVVVANRDIPKGTKLSEADFRVAKFGVGDILFAETDYYSDTSFLKNGDCYAKIDIIANDVIVKSKMQTDIPHSDEQVRELGPNEYAVSVSVSSLAGSVAAKVKVGDIVSPILFDGNSTFIDGSLTYLEVIGVVNSDAADINAKDSSTTGVPSVITFKTNLRQALLLARYENTHTIHLSLVCRGNIEKAQALLDIQEQYFVDNYPDESGSWYYYSDAEAAAQEVSAQ